jgi:hypothetical protein
MKTIILILSICLLFSSAQAEQKSYTLSIIVLDNKGDKTTAKFPDFIIDDDETGLNSRSVLIPLSLSPTELLCSFYVDTDLKKKKTIICIELQDITKLVTTSKERELSPVNILKREIPYTIGKEVNFYQLQSATFSFRLDANKPDDKKG